MTLNALDEHTLPLSSAAVARESEASVAGRSIRLFNVKYSPNLGDGVLSECLEEALAQELGSADVASIDLAGREAYGGSGAGRHLALAVLNNLPQLVRRAAIRLPLVLQSRRKWRPHYRTGVKPCDAVVIGGGNLLADLDLNFPTKLALALDEAARRDLPVAFYGVGSYATGIAVKVIGIPVYLAVPFGGCVGVLLALAFAPTLRLSGVYFAIVSLSLAIILQRVISLMPEWLTGGSLGMNIGMLTDRVQGYYAMLLVLVLALLTASWLAESRLGRALTAIRDDKEAADAMGVNVTRSRLWAWLLSAFFASLVGGVQAWFTGAFDTFTSFDVILTAKSVIYAMAGGMGTVLGPVVGTVVLVWVDEIVWRTYPELNSFLLGLVIAVLILFAPRGLVGTLVRRYPRLRKYIM